MKLGEMICINVYREHLLREKIGELVDLQGIKLELEMMSGAEEMPQTFAVIHKRISELENEIKELRDPAQ